MGFTITLPKKPSAAAKPQKGKPLPKVLKASAEDAHDLSAHDALIDEVGKLQSDALEIETQILSLREKLEPLAEKMGELRSAMDELQGLDPDERHVEYGKSYKVQLGPQGTARKIIDMDEVKALLGTEVFMQLAIVSLGDLDKYLTAAQREQVIEETRTRRNIKIVPRK